MFSIDQINKASAGFETAKEMYSEGIHTMKITELKSWADKSKGFGIRLKGNLEKELYLGFSYQYDVNKFKLLIQCLGINFNGKIVPEDYLGKSIDVKVKHETLKGIKIDDDNSAFNLKDFNEKVNGSFNSMEEVEKALYETFEFKKEKIVGLEKASNATDNFDDGFNLDDEVPF